MGKKDHLPLENLDLNANKEKPEESSLYDLIDVALKSGKIMFFGISYMIVPSQISSSDFVVRNHHRYRIFLRLLHIFFFLFLFIPFVTERITLSSCCLVNFIKKGLHVVVLGCILIGYYCFEIKGRKLDGGVAGIFRQCILLQNKFKAVGLHFPSRAKVRAFGWTVSVLVCFTCMIRQLIFVRKRDPWHDRYSRMISDTLSFGFWQPSNETETVHIILGIIGVGIDAMIANYWMFVQTIHFAFVATMWMIFDKLNRGLTSGYLKTKNLPEVVDLHFQSTKLLKLMNQLISPVTFVSIVYDITCLCFWTNYIALDMNLRPVYIAAVCSFIKTAIELILVADVNSKAHEISEWLEESCADSATLPEMDLMKFTVFTSQIYSKETTGFKGLNFFVVTSHLALAIGGIVITYTVAVTQFCHINESRT